MVLINTLFTLCHCVTKNGSIFLLYLVFRPGMCFQTGHVFFVPEWPKGEFVSIFLATFWIKKKNTLCNGCVLIGWSVFNLESSCYSDNDQIKDNN